MKRILTLCLLISVLCHLSSLAATNVFLDVTGTELSRRINVIPTLESDVDFLKSTTNVTLSAGVADVFFGAQVISAAFTNANFTLTDLSAYVGTNVARVTLQFYGNAATTVSLRTYGDTNTVDDTSMNSVAIASGSTADMTVNTDSSGRVDVKATANTSMRLICFMRRHVFN